MPELMQPAPIGGLNKKDSRQIMEPVYAVEMDNWVPREGFIDVRAGYAAHTTSGITAAVETLIPFEAHQFPELIAAADNTLYDITSAGAAGAMPFIMTLTDLTFTAPDTITSTSTDFAAMGMGTTDAFEITACSEAANIGSFTATNVVGGTITVASGITSAGSGDATATIKFLSATSDLPAVTEDQWNYTQYDDAVGGARMALVNGADTPLLLKYDSGPVAVLVEAGWPPTGPSSVSDLKGVNIYKNRAYYWEANSDSFWYTEPTAIGGTLTEFPVGRVANTGGDIKSIDTWTLDGGENLNDLLVITFTSGTIVIYEGDNPGDSNNWNLQGIYEMGRPVSERTVIKLAGDLVLLTEDGLMPLSKNLISERSVRISISDKIDELIKSAAINYAGNDGWRIIHYPRDDLLIMNIPVSPSLVTYQYVMNTHTGAWCRFTDILTREWTVLDGKAYFTGSGTATAGKVYLFGEGANSDAGTKISGKIQVAWNNLQTPGQQKRMTAVQPSFEIEGTSLAYGLNIQTDFVNDQDPEVSGTAEIDGTPWGSAWGSAWSSSEDNFVSEWRSVEGIGFLHSIRLIAETSNQEIRLHSLNYIFENGGLI